MFENLLQLEERDFEWETDRWESMIRTGCWEDGEGNKEEEFARMKADVEVLRGQVGRLTGWIRVVEGWAATDPAGGAG